MFVTGIVFLFLLKNSIMFSFIFWILTFLAKNLFSYKYFDYKLNFYECGFKNINRGKTSYNINYLTILLLIIIYDSEFLIFIPYSLNIFMFSLEVFLCFFIFLSWFLLSLIFDFFLNSLDWHI
jgi:NADH:ubiquinone oxidoreductase subunit 3 (subunit A)